MNLRIYSYILLDVSVKYHLTQNRSPKNNNTYEVVHCKSPKYATLKQITDEVLILALLLELLVTFNFKQKIGWKHNQAQSLERAEVARGYYKQEIPLLRHSTPDDITSIREWTQFFRLRYLMWNFIVRQSLGTLARSLLKP